MRITSRYSYFNNNFMYNTALQNNINSKTVNNKTNKSTLSKSSTSKLGKLNEMIQNLVDQKHKIVENKNNLISKTLEDGKDIKSIKPQIENYDKQVKTLNEEISKLKLQKNEINYMNYKPKKAKNKNNTQEQENNNNNIDTSHLNNLIKIGSSYSNNKTLASLQKKTSSRAKILKSQIESNQARGFDSKSQQRELSDINSTLSNLRQSIKFNITEINKEIKSDKASKTNKTIENITEKDRTEL